MKNSHLVTGLDIGSKKIRALVGTKAENKSGVEVLVKEEVPSEGMRKGAVVKPKRVSEKVKNILHQINQDVGEKINEVVVNLGGSHTSCRFSEGSVIVSRADHKISQEDIDRVIKGAKTFSLPRNKEILDVYPKEFRVDKEKGIKQPLGMKGVRLEVEILAVCAFSPYLGKLTEAVLGAGVEIEDLVPSSLASAKAVLSKRQKELGVACLDIGAWTSDLAIFEEGDLIHLAVFPMGSSHITNDIAIGLQTEIDIAEKIKKEYGTCIYKKRGKDKKVEFSEGDTSLTFTRRKITKIIKPRVSEIFEQVENELEKVSKKKKLPAGVVITGGGSKMPKIVDLAKKELELPCRTAVSKQKGLNDPAWSASYGLLLRGMELNGEEDSIAKKSWTKLKRILRVLKP